MNLEPGVWSNGSQTIIIREIMGDTVLYTTSTSNGALLVGAASWIADAIREAGYVLILRPGRCQLSVHQLGERDRQLIEQKRVAPSPRIPFWSMFMPGFVCGAATAVFAATVLTIAVLVLRS